MAVDNYDELVTHVGHNIVVVNYGCDNVAVECEDCHIILFDYDSLELKEPAA